MQLHRLRRRIIPTQRVTIVVPFGAGSVTDIMARILADELSKRWGQQVLVENRPGLAGTVGVAKAAPDGYTLMLTSNGHTVAGLVNKNLPFDPVKDFAGITRVSSAPLYLIINPDVPAKNLKELIDLAKAKPGNAQFLLARPCQHDLHRRRAVPQGCRHQHRARAVQERARRGDGGGARRRAHVFRAGQPVEGNGGGRQGAGDRGRHGRSGIPEMPDVPTFKEAGLDYVYDSWFGLMAPAGVPRDIVAKINRDVVAILKSPEVKDKLAKQFVIGQSDTPEQFDKIIKDETAHLTEVFKDVSQ